MKFLIVTHAIHKVNKDKFYSYEPYVREMNLWGNYVDKIKIITPISNLKPESIEIAYSHNNIHLEKVPSFDLLTLKNKLRTIIIIPIILIKIFKGMLWAEHIHLRCPGNIGLLGCIIQILFPRKQKTVKYAGNWDPKSKQPISYRIQKWLISNTFLTKNCKVLVYGDWGNQSKNIKPFFTASYLNKEIEILENKKLDKKNNFIYVGAFTKGKQPLLSIKIIEALVIKGYNVMLHMYGNGELFNVCKNYIVENNLEKNIILHGNQPKNIVKEAYKRSHFLIFISKSEGWPKVVAEAMFWKCLPISSNVSCVKYMLGDGKRGTLVDKNVKVEELTDIIINYLNNEKVYIKQVNEAQKWSQSFTLDSFENEIKKLLVS